MKKVELGGHKVVLYDSIDELPMVRFHRFNKMLLVDAGVGSEIGDFDAHIERAVRYIRNNDRDSAAKELDNLRQNVFLILSEQSTKDLSFACLVKEIDGKPCDDLSDEGLREVLQTLGGVPRGEVAAEMEAAKKKIDGDLILYFSGIFDDVTVREFYDVMKRRAVAMLDGIIEGDTEQRKGDIDALTEKMILYTKPRVFSGRRSVEVQHDKDYESLCLTISKQTGADAKRMTVLEFYNAYEYIRRMAKETQKKPAKSR